jgi:hypothetical protein
LRELADYFGVTVEELVDDRLPLPASVLPPVREAAAVGSRSELRDYETEGVKASLDLVGSAPASQPPAAELLQISQSLAALAARLYAGADLSTLSAQLDSLIARATAVHSRAVTRKGKK